MTAPKRTRVVVAPALALALAASGALVAVGLAAEPAGKRPDLYPALPSNHSNKNSRWIDTYEASGKVLFRFDTVIHNRLGAGALDVFVTGKGADMTQVLWTNGVPPGAVNTDTPLPTASTPGASLVTIPGKTIAYSAQPGHNHFHAPLVARYSLHRTDNALVADAAKNSAGFCLYDSWGAGGAQHYGSGNLCRPGQPDWPGAVRMGISPGYGDFYASQLGDQWIDVTAAAPGTYRLRAEVDPARIYNEAVGDTGDNVITETVTIPGAVVDPPAPRTTAHGTPVTFTLTGSVIGASVKSRRNATCSTTAESCMTPAVPGELHYSLATGPGGAGTATVTDDGRVTFTPAAGFAGTASFTVRARDSRGLGGPPVPVSVTVAGAPNPGVSVSVSPTAASVQTNQSVQFAAQVANGSGPVTWSVNGVTGGDPTVGTISSTGRYTAPAAVPPGGQVTVRATHSASGASATATVSVTQAPPDPEVTIALSPGAVTLDPGATQAFVATVAGTQEPLRWTVNGVEGGDDTVGRITSEGVYTAPAAPPPSAVTIRATAPTSGRYAESFVTVRAPVTPVEPPVRPAPAPQAPPAPPPGPGGAIDLLPTPPRAAKSRVVLRSSFSLHRRRGVVYLRARGVVSRSQAGRKVAIQRIRGNRIVTIARAKVDRKGRFTAMVRVPRTGELSVRALIGSTARTKAASTVTQTVRLPGGGA